MAMTIEQEREAFEASVRQWPTFKDSLLAHDGRYPDYYGNPVVQGAWEGWKAHAHLTQPAQAVDDALVESAIEAFDSKLLETYPDSSFHKLGEGDKAIVRASMRAALTRALGNAQAEGWKVPEGWSVTPERNPLGGKQAMRLRAPDGRSGLYGSFSEEVLVRDFLTSLSPTPPQPEE